jgi:hypothetical protein
VGVVVGAPWVWGWGGPVWNSTVVTEPQTFIERPMDNVPQSSGLWYYCSDPPGYFPHVQSCNRPWTPVTPTPPASPPSGG